LFNENTVREFANLWTTDLSRYALVRLGEEVTIVERVARQALVIEDDAVRKEVVQRMIAAGAIVTDRLPWTPG